MSLLLSTGAFASSLSGAAPGMVLMKPTSIAHSGTSATLGANGQVTFSAVTSLSLNGVFTADFDNYMLSIRWVASTNATLQYRLRAAGTDNSTASSYTRQRIQADGGTVSAVRNALDFGVTGSGYGIQRCGFNVMFYGPFLTQPTASRSLVASDYLSAYMDDNAVTHNQSVSYDGLTLFLNAGPNMTGALQVYGVRS